LKITIIITAILFIYAAFSTIFHETALVGDIGKKIGDTNLYLFGHLAYINIFVLFYPLYKLYIDARVRKDIDFYLGWLLFFISLILFSSLVLEAQDRGFIGTEIVEFLYPLIGKAGLWLFWLMIMALSLVFIIDDDFKFSGFKTKTPKISLSFSWLGSTFSALGKVLKKIFTNPFASPSLEDEMMPVLDVVEEKPKKTRAKRKPAAPKALAKPETLKVKTLDEVDDPVLNEILELEHEMEMSTSSNKSVGTVAKPKNFKLPKLDFLQKAPKTIKKVNEAEIDRKIEELLAKLQQFKVDGDVIRTYSGPLVTTFEFKPAPNVKVSKILNLQDDLAMALSAETIRIQAPWHWVKIS